MGKIIDFEAYRKKKIEAQEKEENKRIYATVLANISHLTHKNPKEGSNESKDPSP